MITNYTLGGRIKPPLGLPINPQHPLAKGLVGSWIMNEGSGLYLNDMSGNGNTGTIVGADWVPGKTGSALDFNGSSDYITATKNLNSFTEFTIIIQFRIDTLSQDHGLYCAWNVNQQIITRIRQNKNVEFYLTTSNGLQSIGNQFDIEIDIDYTIVFKYDGKYIYQYLNGIQCTTPVAQTGAVLPTGGVTYLGFYSGFSYYLSGIIEYAYIYNRALTPQEIQQLYREPYAMFQEPKVSLLYSPPVEGAVVKTINGLALASVKTYNGLAIGSVKTINGADTQ